MPGWGRYLQSLSYAAEPIKRPLAKVLPESWGKWLESKAMRPEGFTFSDWLGDNELRDPILRWASKLGDTTDSMNRLDGWNALLRQGVDPIEASKRIKAAQVDYS